MGESKRECEEAEGRPRLAVDDDAVRRPLDGVERQRASPEPAGVVVREASLRSGEQVAGVHGQQRVEGGIGLITRC